MKHVARSEKPCEAFAKGECKWDPCIYTHVPRLTVGDSMKGASAPPEKESGVGTVVGAGIPFAKALPPASFKPKEDKKAFFETKPAAEELRVASTTLERVALRKVLEARAPKISSQSKDVIAYAQVHGWKLNIVEDITIDHCFSHLCRDRATLYVGHCALSNLTNTRTLSIYGVQRDRMLLEVKADEKCGRSLSNTVTLGPRAFYPGDCTRAIERQDPEGVYDCVYAVDVYWNGKQGVGPKDYTEWCLLSRTRTIYVVTRMFRGAAGWDEEFVKQPDGVWYRDEQDMIVFSPDRGNFNYPRHFDVNFLEHKAWGKLSIRHQATFGPYCVFAIHLDGVDTTPVAVHLTPSEPPISWTVVEKPTLWGHIGCFELPRTERFPAIYEMFVKERRFLTYQPILADMGFSNAIRAPTGYVFDGVAAKVADALKTNVGVQELKLRFPTVYENLIRGTSFATMYKNRKAVAHDLLHVRQDHGDAEAQLLLARNVTPLTQTRSCCKSFTAVLVLFWLVSLMFAALSRVPTTYAQQPVAHAPRWTAFYDQWEDPLFGLADEVPMFEKPICIGVAATQNIVEDPYYFVFGVLLLISLTLYVYGQSRRRVNLFTEWLDARLEFYGSEKKLSHSGWQRVSETAYIPPVEITSMPKHVPRGTLKIYIDGKEMTPQLAWEVLQRDSRSRLLKYGGWNTPIAPNSLWPVIMCSGTMYAPEKSEANLIFAAYVRIHCPVTSTATEADLERNWALAGFIMRGLYEDAALTPPTLKECASVWSGAKAQVFLDTAENIEIGRHRPLSKGGAEYHTKKELNVKTNETIKEKDGQIKPRSIVVMGNEHHVLHAPWARAVATYMHAVLNGQWQRIRYLDLGGWSTLQVRIWFASGLTGEELSEIGRAIDAGDNVIAVAGDDIIMRIGPHIIEGDLSACDQSHTIQCVKECVTYYRKMGVPEHICEDFVKSCVQPYVARYKRVCIKGDPGCELPTGSDWTTVDNTSAVLSGCVLMATELKTTFEYEQVALCCESIMDKLGFKLKVQVHQHVSHGTFLKGLFLPDRQGRLCWFNLPSMVAKIGKLQRPPSQYGGLSQISRAMALGMGAVPRDFPILGAAIAALHRNGTFTKLRMNAGEDGWYKPTPMSDGIDRDTALEVICRRYDISRLDVLRVEHLYDSVNALPAFVMDPVFNTLVARDYE